MFNLNLSNTMETIYLGGKETKGFLTHSITMRIPSRKSVLLRYYEYVVGYYRNDSFVEKHRVDSIASAQQLCQTDSALMSPYKYVILKVDLKLSRIC